MKYSWSKIFKEFRESYPELWRRGTTYRPYSLMAIEIAIPCVGKLIYDRDADEIFWLEHWVDDAAIRKREKDMRPDMSERFCDTVKNYINTHGMTQQQFADFVGISRYMLNGYLNGRTIPKISTMRKICECINVNI